MNRRRFVVSSLVLGGAAVTAYVSGAQYWARDREEVQYAGDSDEERLLCVFRDPRSAATVGKRYLSDDVERSSCEQIVADLKVDLVPPEVSLSELPPGQLVATIAQKIRRDFANDRVVDLDGWILSQTEISLCVLAAVNGTEA